MSKNIFKIYVKIAGVREEAFSRNRTLVHMDGMYEAFKKWRAHIFMGHPSKQKRRLCRWKRGALHIKL